VGIGGAAASRFRFGNLPALIFHFAAVESHAGSSPNTTE
jgi:hypothetical protein